MKFVESPSSWQIQKNDETAQSPLPPPFLDYLAE